jgi:hypothetical protein
MSVIATTRDSEWREILPEAAETLAANSTARLGARLLFRL